MIAWQIPQALRTLRAVIRLTAARLAVTYGCEVAASNQEVVDRSEGVFVALPSARGMEELSRLRFRPEQPVLSAMAGTRAHALSTAIGPACGDMAMMPGYANALRIGPSILFPGASFWRTFLGHVGPVLVLQTEDQFVAAAAFGALSGASFAWMAQVIDWFTAQGLPPDQTRKLVAATLRGNAEVLLQEDLAMEDILRNVATPGGITELLVAKLTETGGLEAWERGLDAVAQRLEGIGQA
ncbi:pyrroline-5-carboxylate reductase dimerization domain-containing protein [Tabrizicola sp. BL-A-41-H6]|uniref:pyrroline-5-carboxylate reductase dimerization domain-containing protein n=1 Tax=Tabrizicola sp. BL-A-41-H6 TaxID=3421107 RepID=UPI003D66CB1E